MVEHMLRDNAAAYGWRWMSLRYFNAAGADPDGEIGELHDPETHAVPLAISAALGRVLRSRSMVRTIQQPTAQRSETMFMLAIWLQPT
jgi:UDP-glucose 4-epimerase